MSVYKKFGRKVVDATAPLTIRVQPIDIAGAICRDHQKCVIANAIKRTKRVAFVDVGATTVIIGSGKHEGYRYRLDSLGRQVVRYFDLNKGKAAPTKITLRPPQPARQIGKRKGEKGGIKLTKSKRAKPTR